MSTVNLLSSFKEKPTDGSLKEGSKHEGDDDARGGGGCGDPAVLAVGSVLRPLTYTRDELLKLRNSPLVKQGFEKLLANCDALVLVLKKRTDSPNEEDRGAKGDAPTENHKSVFTNARGERERERRSADPRERVRKESEPTGGGIVLSPQRRSFTSGCGAPAASAPAPPHVARTRPESPLSSAAASLSNGKSDQVRRVGSGRLMMRDMTTAPWEREEGERDSFRDSFRGTNREREERTIPRSNDSRYERRSFNRDNFHSDVKRERDDRFIYDKREDNRRSNNRYSRRFDKEEEPEWFSGGPTSQLETIELRGFDDPPKRNGNVSSKSEKWSSGSRSPQESWREHPSTTSPANDSPTVSSTPTVNHDEEQQEKESNEKSEEHENMTSLDHADFNFDEFLKFESIPDILTNGTSDGEGGGSRFSRYFQRSETPTQHYERLLHNLVDESDNNCSVPPPSNVFAPISPAAPPSHVPNRGQPPSLMDLLRRAHSNEHHESMNSVSGGGKMHSLEELEARIRPQHPPPPMHQPPQQDHDLSAFKRLLAQVSGGHAVPAEPQPRPPHQPPMSLLQMLKSMEQQKPQQPHIPQDLLYKLLQVQRQQEVGPGMHPGMTPQDRDLLQRPEAIALIQGLKSGEITIQHLMQQLNNPAVQCRHRELLLAILRMHHNQHRLQLGGSPLPVGVQPPHLIVPPTVIPPHQQLRLSPIPHHSVPQRIPSPRELAVHTQSIMQSALIKKKLEEQKENYRRRTEQMAKQTPPISFTPTSVLRKMTADKEEPLSPKQQWNQPPKMPQGRPIVKGNQSGVPSGMGFSPSPSEFQHFINQQQMAANRAFPHPHQRQQIPPTMNNMNRGAPGTTLHQLLVQSHQRSMNEMGGGSGGGDNQLARWFSPELLARASAGKLPSVHVPNALSLEDLERGHHSPAVRN